MARYKLSKKPETPDEKLRRLFEDGKLIQMHSDLYGVRYVENTDHAIEMKRRQGFVHVEYDEKVVKEPKVKADEPKPAAKKKASSKGGAV